jgi:hypothetical protein
MLLFSIANSVGSGRLDRHDFNAMGFEGGVVPQHAPSDAGELVGERGCQLVAM